MTWKPGQSGNPLGAGKRAKPFREALNIESKLADEGEETPAKPGSIRYIARQLLVRAGAETAAAKEVADRMDGKVPQAIVGDDEEAPIRVSTIERLIVSPADSDG